MNDHVVNAIYEGTIRHRRFAVAGHEFSYNVFMMLADIDRIEEITRHSPLWSYNRFNLASFHDADFLAQYSGTLHEKVDAVLQQADRPLASKVFLLANWRYLGYIINPISCYFCYNENNELQTLIAEVTNTPWKERKVYVLPCQPGQRFQHIRFGKSLHVSPFFDMDMEYRLHCSEPHGRLSLQLENFSGEEKLFDATLALQRRPVSSRGLLVSLLRYPLMTARVFAAIHWQALKLFIKKVPVQVHPDKAFQQRG